MLISVFVNACSSVFINYSDISIFADDQVIRMKINEKTLISYAASAAPTDREGWLLKRGEVRPAEYFFISSFFIYLFAAR